MLSFLLTALYLPRFLLITPLPNSRRVVLTTNHLPPRKVLFPTSSLATSDELTFHVAPQDSAENLPILCLNNAVLSIGSAYAQRGSHGAFGAEEDQSRVSEGSPP
jgi:hypothetical protein